MDKDIVLTILQRILELIAKENPDLTVEFKQEFFENSLNFIGKLSKKCN